MVTSLSKNRVFHYIIFSFFLSLFFYSRSFAQSVGINSSGAAPHASAALDVSATNQGVLIPRVALTATNTAGPVSSPATSLLVYNTATAGTSPTNVVPGYYYWDGSKWVPLMGTATGSGWNLTGNFGTVPYVNFIGTMDNQPIMFKANRTVVGFLPSSFSMSLFLGYEAGNANEGISNVGIGNRSLYRNVSGIWNTALGTTSLYSNTTGESNVATGYGALYSNSTGNNNTAVGNTALRSNTKGESNTAVGLGALYSNETGYSNVAIGAYALAWSTYSSNTVAIGDSALHFNGRYSAPSGFAINNTAVGSKALYSNTTGFENTAVGRNSLKENTDGFGNTAMGLRALQANVSGDKNVTIGLDALLKNVTGDQNTAIGSSALSSSTTQSNLVAVGYNALANNGIGATLSHEGTRNTAIGSESLYSNTIGYDNTAVGYYGLINNINGHSNTAVGSGTLGNNTEGNNNVAVAPGALSENTTGSYNVAIGAEALLKSSSGNNNTAIGYYTLINNTTGFNNTAVGSSALLAMRTGSNNTAIGRSAGPSLFSPDALSNTGAFGSGATITASNSIRIGNTSITSISGQVPWSSTSDQRFKVDVQENVKGLDFILKLRPVTYHWDIDSLNRFIYGKAADSLFADSVSLAGIANQEGITYTGFLAQEVEAAAKSVGFDFSGVIAPANEHTPYSVRYAEFVVPLVKAVQEQHSQLGQQNELLVGLSSRLDRPVIKLASAEEWADRVFEPAYRLRPLGEVEQYLKQHKHLPGIPSAQELVEKGIDVSQMLSRQMEKIEELTLYVVEVEKKNKELGESNADIRQENEAIRQMVIELQKEMKSLRIHK